MIYYATTNRGKLYKIENNMIYYYDHPTIAFPLINYNMKLFTRLTLNYLLFNFPKEYMEQNKNFINEFLKEQLND